MDLAFAALACDLTRVMVLQVSTSTSLIYCEYLFNRKTNKHFISHNDIPVTNAWVTMVIDEAYVYLLETMKAVPEETANGMKTMLDNSALVWTSGGRAGTAIC